MDKMVQSANGEVTITNDGATILNLMPVLHPAAKMVCRTRIASNSNIHRAAPPLTLTAAGGPVQGAGH